MRKPFIDSLVIARKFNTFWDGYQLALILYFMIRGPLLLYDNEQLARHDRNFLYSVGFITVSLITSLVVSATVSIVLCLLSIPCGEKIRDKLFGAAHDLSMVVYS